MQMTPPLWKKVKRNYRASWWKWKSRKTGLELNIQKTKIMESSSITSWQIDGGTVETLTGFIFLDSKITADGGLHPWNEKTLVPWKKSYDQPRQHIKKQRHYFADKGPSSWNGFSSSCVWMWELDHKESWALKNWCFWTVVLEKTLQSLLDSKEIQPVNPKRNQSVLQEIIPEYSLEAEAPTLWPPDAKNWLIGRDPDSGKDWRQKEKGRTEDERIGWHHRLDRHKFE